MNLENKKVNELKKLCDEKKLKNYSKLNKQELIQLLSKKNNKKQKGGFNQDIYDLIKVEQSKFSEWISEKSLNLHDYLNLLTNKKNKEKYKFNSYLNADLRSADLSNMVLHNTNLTNADLTHANLTNIDLTYANLTKAILINANLTDSHLSGVNLKSAELMGVY